VREIAPRYITIKEPAALDRDWGTDTLRAGLTNGMGADAIVAQWQSRLDAFMAVREKYLLYEDESIP